MKSTPKQNLITVALTGALALLGGIAPATAADSKPNILFIIADDLGWKDVGYHGSPLVERSWSSSTRSPCARRRGPA